MALPPYDQYPQYQEECSIVDTIGLWLAGLFGVAFIMWLSYQTLIAINIKYGPNGIALVVIGLISLPVVWLLARGIYRWWGNWMFDIDISESKRASAYYDKGKIINNNATLSNKPTTIKPIAYAVKKPFLLAGERKTAPRATFFGRIDGKDVQATGKYEEQWLNTHEFGAWVAQKARTDAYEAGLVSKTIIKSDLVVNTTTKVEY